VAPTYGPEGKSLISTVVVGTPGSSDAELEGAVRAQMQQWYGVDATQSWRHLRTYRIRWAQFDQSPGALEPAARPVRRSPGLYVCGDHVENASINGALAAGRRAAEAVIHDLAARTAPST
jgi:predicted NAD/FAD-dependent oxidoreductase